MTAEDNIHKQLKQYSHFLSEYAICLQASGVHTTRVMRNTCRIASALGVNVKMTILHKTLNLTISTHDGQHVYDRLFCGGIGGWYHLYRICLLAPHAYHHLVYPCVAADDSRYVCLPHYLRIVAVHALCARPTAGNAIYVGFFVNGVTTFTVVFVMAVGASTPTLGLRKWCFSMTRANRYKSLQQDPLNRWLLR